MLTVPLFNGALLPWTLSMLGVTAAVFAALAAYSPELRSG
jgi:hypothetical protein